MYINSTINQFKTESNTSFLVDFLFDVTHQQWSKPSIRYHLEHMIPSQMSTIDSFVPRTAPAAAAAAAASSHSGGVFASIPVDIPPPAAIQQQQQQPSAMSRLFSSLMQKRPLCLNK
jgi:hypothetical protein